MDAKLAIIVTRPNGEEMILKEGDLVIITTDNTDYDEIYSGEITFLSIDEICVSNLEDIKFEYVVDIDFLQ